MVASFPPFSSFSESKPSNSFPFLSPSAVASSFTTSSKDSCPASSPNAAIALGCLEPAANLAFQSVKLSPSCLPKAWSNFLAPPIGRVNILAAVTLSPVFINVFSWTVVAAAWEALLIASSCDNPSSTALSYVNLYTSCPPIAPSTYANSAAVKVDAAEPNPFAICAPLLEFLNAIAKALAPPPNTFPTPYPVTANSPIDSIKFPPWPIHHAGSPKSKTCSGFSLYTEKLSSKAWRPLCANSVRKFE